jgi:hypothetical protein
MENSFLNEIIVPLNQQTLNGQSAPIAYTSPYDIYCAVDGWFWDNTINDSNFNSTLQKINWTIRPKNNNGESITMPYVNRIYMNCYIYKFITSGTPLSAIPKIAITLTGNYGGTITFAYTGTAITNAGYYCFVADIASNTSTFGQIYNENADIFSLSYENSGNSLSSINITQNIIAGISIVTNTTSNYRIIVSSISLEINNSTNTFGGSTDISTAQKNSGVTQYIFNSNTVNTIYDQNTLSYIYQQFYNKLQANKISPLTYTVPTAST